MNKSLFLCLIFVLSGCAAKLTFYKDPFFNTQKNHLKVAVLPFISNNKEDEPIAVQVREEIVANLQEGNYEIAEITEVDQSLKRAHYLEPQQLLRSIKKQQVDLKEVLDVDLVICGRIVEWTKTYLALHSDVELDVELFVFEAATGKMVAKIRKGEIKASGLSRIPTGYVSVGASPILGLQESVQQEVIHNLTRSIVQPLLN